MVHPLTRENAMSNIITCEQVSDGHPDKICDQIADRIVTECLRNDRNSRVAVEVLIKDYNIVIAGELTSKYSPDYEQIVGEVRPLRKRRLPWEE